MVSAVRTRIAQRKVQITLPALPLLHELFGFRLNAIRFFVATDVRRWKNLNLERPSSLRWRLHTLHPAASASFAFRNLVNAASAASLSAAFLLLPEPRASSIPS